MAAAKGGGEEPGGKAAPRAFRFASFTLDLDRVCLNTPAGEVKLRPKSFEVLRYLVAHAERVVTKDEVIETVWSGVTVTEESLTRCVSEIRRALGGEGHRIIRTVPKHGYVLDVPAEPSPARPQHWPARRKLRLRPASPPPGRPRRRSRARRQRGARRAGSAGRPPSWPAASRVSRPSRHASTPRTCAMPSPPATPASRRSWSATAAALRGIWRMGWSPASDIRWRTRTTPSGRCGPASPPRAP